MRRLTILLALSLPLIAHAAPRSDKETMVNTRYIERNPNEAGDKFEEAKLDLPPLPENNAQWFDLYTQPGYPNKPQIDLNSVTLAPDNTIRYTLNIRSAGGYDNITSEALYCAESSFNAQKKSSYKIYGYADPVNKRWIKARNPQWREIGAILNSADPVRGTLYRAFCEDGLPGSQGKLIERLKSRAGTQSKTGWDKK